MHNDISKSFVIKQGVRWYKWCDASWQVVKELGKMIRNYN